MSGLFAIFNTAKKGMLVQQKSIEVTSHNISNANTVGYSRQKAIIQASTPSSSGNVGQTGTGAQIVDIERIRDTFLDHQVRQETSSLGKYDTRSNILSQVESVFNELSKEGISASMSKFFDSFQELAKTPNSSFSRTMVIEESVSLCNILNSTSSKLDDVEKGANELIKNDLGQVNSLANQINKLNKEIIEISSSGQSPNDLMDQRDLLIDELSKKISITVDKTNYNGVNIKLQNGAEGNTSLIVSSTSDKQLTRLSYVTSITKKDNVDDQSAYVIKYMDLNDSSGKERTVTLYGLSDEDLKNIEINRTVITDKDGVMIRNDGTSVSDGDTVDVRNITKYSSTSGSINGATTAKTDIQKYRDELDKIAKLLALTVNAVHSGVTNPLNDNGQVDKDYMPFFVNKDCASYSSSGELINLDVTLKNENNITAKNISINKELINDVAKIKTKTNDHLYKTAQENTIDAEGDGSRALAIADIRNKLINISNINISEINREDLFSSSKTGLSLNSDKMTIQGSSNGMKIESYFKELTAKLSVQIEESDRVLDSQNDLVYSLEEARVSSYGVSLDEEMANLVQFQHAYNASAKVISTINELLDVIVNGLIT